MKREAQPFCPTYIIKTIPSTDKSHQKNTQHIKSKSPRDIGNTYITVPVYKQNERFTKKQIKEATSMYHVQSSSPHSFVLSLKSDPSTHIAIPYYRINEVSLNGRSMVSVSNFFPSITQQATPPCGINVIGQTAQLLPVERNSLQSMFVCSEADVCPSPSLSISQPTKKLTQLSEHHIVPTSPTQPVTNQVTNHSQPVSPTNQDPHHLTTSLSSSSDISSKRQRLAVDPITNSHWQETQFICDHSEVSTFPPKQTLPISHLSDLSLLSEILSHTQRTGSLTVSLITTLFPNQESDIIKLANCLTASGALHYYQSDEGVSDGVYVLGERGIGIEEEGFIVERIISTTLMEQEKAEFVILQKRVELLERLTLSDDTNVCDVLEALLRVDPLLFDNPFYRELQAIPLIEEAMQELFTVYL